MSLRSRLTQTRERDARAAVLEQYARAAQVQDERLELAGMLSLPITEEQFRRAAYRCLRAWELERDDPEPGT